MHNPLRPGISPFTVKDEALDLSGLEEHGRSQSVLGSLKVVEDPYNLGQKLYSYTIRGGDGERRCRKTAVSEEAAVSAVKAETAVSVETEAPEVPEAPGGYRWIRGIRWVRRNGGSGGNGGDGGAGETVDPADEGAMAGSIDNSGSDQAILGRQSMQLKQGDK